MDWNYRVIQHTDQHSIHVVYYDDQGNPTGFSADPAQVTGNTVEELSSCLIHLTAALARPVILSNELQQKLHRDHTVKTALDIARTGKSDV